jgi:hypothetical protein
MSPKPDIVPCGSPKCHPLGGIDSFSAIQLAAKSVARHLQNRTRDPETISRFQSGNGIQSDRSKKNGDSSRMR